MKSFKKICRGLVCLLFVNTGYSQTISTHFFGENAWMPDTIGATVYYGRLHSHWSDIQNSHAGIIRFGGIGPDKDMPTNFQYIRMIDSIRAKGMEPIMQVPFYNYRYTAAQAAAIVTYLNVTRAKNIKYWIIANEPDNEYHYSTASQIAAYLRPFASAMKAADPSILIIGPETSWFYTSIIDGLTAPGGPDDITGRDGNGRYYIDYFSFHAYAFNGTQTRAQAISNLTAAGKFQDNLIYLNSRLAACDSFHSRAGTAAIRTAVTEANINWQSPADDNLSGVGANSFLGGQFIAEMFGLGMKNSLEFMNIWSVIEGSSLATNNGYIDPTTNTKKPEFYHFQMVAGNMKGSYANGTTNSANVKSFGSVDAQHVAVLVMNEELTTNYPYTVRLNTAAVSGTNPLKININANIAVEYNDVIASQSSVLLTFDLAGNITQRTVYSLTTHALASLPPAVTNFSTASVPAANFSASATQVCAGSSVTFSDLSTNTPTAWAWTFTGGTPSTSTVANPLITYNTAGTYAVTLTATNGAGSNTRTTTGYITVTAAPATPGAISGFTTGLCPRGIPSATYTIVPVAGATSYTWTTPTGATITSGQGTAVVTVSFNHRFSSGNLSVKAGNSCGISAIRTLSLNGCSAPVAVMPDDSSSSTASVTEISLADFEINVFPNPSDGKFTVTMDASVQQKKLFKIEVLNAVGQQVYLRTSDFSTGKEDIILNDIVAGIYIVRIDEGNRTVMKRIMIQR
jgi:PKD repeat protein